MALEETKYAHGRYPVAIDLSSADYEALTDGLGRPIPFQLNLDDGAVLLVKLVDDDSAFVAVYFNAGDNPAQVIAVDDASGKTTGLVAIYPFKPATTTIST